MRELVSRPFGPICLAGLMLAGLACAPQPDAPASDEGAPSRDAPLDVVIAEIGLRTPESVLHDPDADVYLVSNINGKPDEKDGNGFISRFSPEGHLVDLVWIDGSAPGVTLHAPKGSAIVGDELFVADIDTVRVFSRLDGAPLREIRVPGAVFLNDVVADGGRSVYVSDSQTHTVHRIDSEGMLTALVTDEAIAKPNGLAVGDEGLLVADFGSETVFSVDDAGGLDEAFELPDAGLDGIVVLEDGSTIVSSWRTESIYAVDGEGQIRALLEEIAAPADIGLDATRNRLLVPLFFDDKIILHSLDSTTP